MARAALGASSGGTQPQAEPGSLSALKGHLQGGLRHSAEPSPPEIAQQLPGSARFSQGSPLPLRVTRAEANLPDSPLRGAKRGTQPQEPHPDRRSSSGEGCPQPGLALQPRNGDRQPPPPPPQHRGTPLAHGGGSPPRPSPLQTLRFLPERFAATQGRAGGGWGGSPCR